MVVNTNFIEKELIRFSIPNSITSLLMGIHTYNIKSIWNVSLRNSCSFIYSSTKFKNNSRHILLSLICTTTLNSYTYYLRTPINSQ